MTKSTTVLSALATMDAEKVIESATVLSAFVMAAVENRNKFGYHPIAGLFQIALTGGCYAIIAEVALELIPTPAKVIVPTVLTYWSIRALSN